MAFQLFAKCGARRQSFQQLLCGMALTALLGVSTFFYSESASSSSVCRDWLAGSSTVSNLRAFSDQNSIADGPTVAGIGLHTLWSLISEQSSLSEYLKSKLQNLTGEAGLKKGLDALTAQYPDLHSQIMDRLSLMAGVLAKTDALPTGDTLVLFEHLASELFLFEPKPRGGKPSLTELTTPLSTSVTLIQSEYAGASHKALYELVARASEVSAFNYDDHNRAMEYQLAALTFHAERFFDKVHGLAYLNHLVALSELMTTAAKYADLAVALRGDGGPLAELGDLYSRFRSVHRGVKPLLAGTLQEYYPSNFDVRIKDIDALNAKLGQ